MIVLRVFQSVRELTDYSVTRLDKNKGLALEMRDLTELHWARNFLRSKRDFQRRQHCSSRLRSRLTWRISGLMPGVCMGSLDNCFGFDLGHGCREWI